MKIRLLNDGGYKTACRDVLFPAEVDAVSRDGCYYVRESELARIGADMDLFVDVLDPWWPFLPSEVEVIS